jgi:hypothetical protein
VKDHAQYDYHFFTKLDSKDPKTRKMVEENWCGLEEGMMVEGQKVNEVKYFK